MPLPRGTRADRVLYLTVLVAAAFLAAYRPVAIDLWLRLSDAGVLLSSLRSADFFGQPRQALSFSSQWLLDLGLYGVYRLAGEAGIRVLGIFFSCAVMHLILRNPATAGVSEHQQPRPLLCWWLVILALPAVCLGEQFTSDHVTVLLVLIWFRVLEAYGPRGGLRLAVRLCPLQILWSNADPRFMLGPLLAAMWCLGRWLARPSGTLQEMDAASRGRLASVYRQGMVDLASLGLLVLCGLLTPQGTESLWTSMRLLLPSITFHGEAERLISILVPTLGTDQIPLPKIIWGVLLGLAVASFFLRWHDPAPARCLVLATVGVLGFLAVRDAMLAGAMAAAVGVANRSDAQRWRANQTGSVFHDSTAARNQRMFLFGRVATLCVVSGGILVSAMGLIPFRCCSLSRSVAGASDLTGAGPLLTSLGWHGNLFAPDMEHVGQLIWLCGRGTRSLVEPRLESWDQGLTEYRRLVEDVLAGNYSEYLHTNGTWRGWRRPFDEHQIDLIALSTKQLVAYRRLLSNPYWAILYHDDRVILLGRRSLPQFDRAAATARARLRDREWPCRREAAQATASNRWARWWPPSQSQRIETQLGGARSLLALRMPTAATRQMRQLLREYPREPRAYEMLGEANLMLASREEMESGQPSWLRPVIASHCFQRAIELDPMSQEPRLGLAEAAAIAGSWDLALRHSQTGRLELDRAMLDERRTPETPSRRSEVLLGTVAMIEGRYDDAVSAWQRASARVRAADEWPDPNDLCYWIALAYIEGGNCAEARKWLQQALQAADRETPLAPSIREYLNAMPKEL